MQNLQQLPLRDFRAALGYDEESLVVPTLPVVTRVVCSYVGQEPVMFAQSLRENLTMVRIGCLSTNPLAKRFRMCTFASASSI